MKKTGLITLFFTIFVAVLVAFSACNNTPEFYLNKSGIELNPYATERLLTSYTGTVEWSSSDESVAVVNQEGLVTALSVGEAVITAVTDTNLKATCLVTVTQGSLEPQIVVAKSEIKLLENEYFPLSARFVINGKSVAADLTYISQDTKIAEITSEGVVIAKGLGQTEVVITADTGAYKVNRTVTVKVREDIEIVPDLQEIELFITSPSAEFITEQTLEVTVRLNGEEIDNPYPALSFGVEDTDIVNYIEGERKIVAAGLGRTKVQISYLSARGTTETLEIDVIVQKALVRLSQQIIFDLSSDDGDLHLDFDSLNIDVENSSIININAVTGDSEAELDFHYGTGNSVYISREDLSKGETAFILITDTVDYRMEGCMADSVIYNKAQLKAFLDEIANSPASQNIMQGKYYALGADINLSKSELDYDQKYNLPVIAWDRVFAGTFDGRGYTISNAVVAYGLFNYIGGTVKNLSLIEAEANLANGRGGFVGALVLSTGTVENIYIDGTKVMVDGQNGGIVYGVEGTVRNCIAKFEYDLFNAQYAYGAVAYAMSATSRIENCYIISQTAQQLIEVENGTFLNNYSFTSEETLLQGEYDFDGFGVLWVHRADQLPLLRSYYDFIINQPVLKRLSNELYIDLSQGSTCELDIYRTGLECSEILRITLLEGISEIDITFDIVDGIMIDTQGLTTGVKTFLLYTDGVVYEISVCVADGVIRDKAGLIAFLNSIANAPAGKVMTGKYYVLASDIVLDKTELIYGTANLPGIGWDREFNGIFDGRGHSIVNAKVAYGIFNYVSGTVRNLSLIDAEAYLSNGRGGFVCAIVTESGIIENIYVSGTKSMIGDDAYNGGLVYANFGTIKNCIAVFDYLDYSLINSHGAIAYADSATSITMNCFVISNAAKMFNSGYSGAVSNVGLYASAQALLSDWPDFRSFGGLWQITEGELPALKNPNE